MILGSYFFDNSEGHNVFEKIFCILFLFFFGGFLVVAELTIAEKIAKWWDSSELNFLWQVYIIKKYDKLFLIFSIYTVKLKIIILPLIVLIII